jgi:sugar phosphate permease
MGGHDYNNALTIFFISYGLAEPATNVMLKRLTPRVFFTGIILLWGLIMTLMGLVENKAALLACRFLLGLAEAGLFPGMAFSFESPNASKLTFYRCKLLPVLLVQAL